MVSFFYIFNAADILTTEETVLGAFADETVIMTTDTIQEKESEKLQAAIKLIRY